MMFTPRTKILSAIAAALLLASLSGCEQSKKTEAEKPLAFTSFRDIPGITADEIKAIDAILEEQRQSGKPFTYGMIISAEAFMSKKTGKLDGYSALICDWLTELFDVPFELVTYEWGDLLDALERHEVDFAGDLTATEERRKKYFMTRDITERALYYTRIEGSPSFEEILATRPVRYAVLRDTTTIDTVVATLDPGTFEIVSLDDRDEVYDMMKRGEVDAYINENPLDPTFDQYDDVAYSIFFPVTISTVTLATQNPKFEPIIDAIDKALEHGGTDHFRALYARGLQRYNLHKLFGLFNEEERAYVERGNVVKIAAEYGNYPISFYNAYDQEWQGILFEVLSEVEAYTGLTFEIANDTQTDWSELLRMLESG
jgi:ABC-type amino acid transport substrate-binding protein